MYQGTQADIIIGSGFALQKLTINSASAALNAEKDEELLLMHYKSVICSDFNAQHGLIASFYE